MLGTNGNPSDTPETLSEARAACDALRPAASRSGRHFVLRSCQVMSLADEAAAMTALGGPGADQTTKAMFRLMHKQPRW